jgi:hypothetical protein
MGSKPSEQMMDLLKELALLKQQDENGTGSNVDPTELESRRNRRREISEQIIALGGPVG